MSLEKTYGVTMWFSKNKSRDEEYELIIDKLEETIRAQQELIKIKDQSLMKINAALMKLESRQQMNDTSIATKVANRNKPAEE